MEKEKERERERKGEGKRERKSKRKSTHLDIEFCFNTGVRSIIISNNLRRSSTNRGVLEELEKLLKVSGAEVLLEERSNGLAVLTDSAHRVVEVVQLTKESGGDDKVIGGHIVDCRRGAKGRG